MKFKVGDKVRNIITDYVGTVKEIEENSRTYTYEEEINRRLGNFKRVYCVSYEEGFSNWQSIVEIEKVKEILDEKEKEYLKNLIKPFGNRILSIKKKISCDDSEAFIVIWYKTINNNTCCFSLPNFLKNSMYKGMEIEKEYTLKELNLD